MAAIPGFTAAETNAYIAALLAPGAQTHRRATAYNISLDHSSARSLENITGGQLRWNGSEDVRTEQTIIFSDFDDQITLDHRHAVRTELGVDTSLGRLWAPLGTGWVQGNNDAGWETEIITHGYEKFGLRVSDRGRAKRGERVGEVIHRMHNQIGLRSVIPDHLRENGPKLAEAVEWGGGKPEKCVTRMSRKLAKRAGLQVYFDQLARVDLRPIPDQPRVSFVETAREDDVEVRLLEAIRWAEDYSELCDRVIGAGRRDLRSVANARGALLDLVMNGKPLHFTHRFSDDSIDNRADLKDLTEQTAKRLSTARSRVEITSTPAPWLVAEDKLYAEKRDGRNKSFFLETGSLELDGSSMAIGYQQVLRRAKGIRLETTGRGYTEKERRQMRKEARERRERRQQRNRQNGGRG